MRKSKAVFRLEQRSLLLPFPGCGWKGVYDDFLWAILDAMILAEYGVARLPEGSEV